MPTAPGFMPSATGFGSPKRPGVFEHEAFLYSDRAGFVAGVLPFLQEGAAAGERMLVLSSEAKIRLLQDNLGGQPADLAFLDVKAIGPNPANILTVWEDFVGEGDGGARGISEQMWEGRSPASLVECHHHETVLNQAFWPGPVWRLLCPYDVAALNAEMIGDARRTHPLISDGAGRRASTDFASDGAWPSFDDPLPDRPEERVEVAFDGSSLHELRQLVVHHATVAGLPAAAVDDVVVAVNEIATNSIRHGGGGGALRMWRHDGSLVCEVSDAGRITDRLVGRRRPPTDDPGGRGVWIANHLCDLVQIRSGAGGTTVRLHVTLS